MARVLSRQASSERLVEGVKNDIVAAAAIGTVQALGYDVIVTGTNAPDAPASPYQHARLLGPLLLENIPVLSLYFAGITAGDFANRELEAGRYKRGMVAELGSVACYAAAGAYESIWTGVGYVGPKHSQGGWAITTAAISVGLGITINTIRAIPGVLQNVRELRAHRPLRDILE